MEISTRCAVALILMVCGLATINGSSFGVLDSTLDQKMGALSGEWLARAFFAYSDAYRLTIGIATIAGATLLMYEKTALIGSLMMWPIAGNVLLIGLCFGIPLWTATGGIAVAALAWILWRHDLRDKNANVPIVIRFVISGLATALVFGLDNYDRAPTPIDGTWRVAEVEPAMRRADAPAMLFFERNRAHLCVYKTRDGSYQSHYFEVDPAKRTIAIWSRWKGQGKVLFQGSYEMPKGELLLKGTLGDNISALEMRLDHPR